MTKPHLIALAVLALTLAACADTNRVVLMPDPDGHVGKVEVTTKAGAQTLTQAKSVGCGRFHQCRPQSPERHGNRQDLGGCHRRPTATPADLHPLFRQRHRRSDP